MPFPEQLDPQRLPNHIAIIMDGNGRWAKKRRMLRTMGHKIGVESVQDIVKTSRRLGIKVLTLYAFSSENWQRPTLEVKTLMALLKSYLAKELNNLIKNNIRLISIGQHEKLPGDVRKVLNNAILKTAGNDGLLLNLALSYGSRYEITEAVKKILSLCMTGELAPEQVDEVTISNHLYTRDVPDPDLIIRTGGESRLSNFLLWQASYAEIYITDTYWPDFREPNLISAIEDYQTRQRRFGKTGDQIKGSKT